MKLHLPKMLRVALLSVMVSVATYSANADDIKLESSSTTMTLDSLTVSGSDRVGYIDSEGNLYTNFGNNTRTQNLTINSDLTIAGNGHVAVGGGNADLGSAAYLKVANGTLTVKDSGKLTALGCEIKNLVIEGGTVNLDAISTNYCGSGNSSYSAGSNKQASITNSLTISGGNLYMGSYNGAYITKGLTSYHCSAGFKGSINQTGGLMSVRTDAAFNGAATINQTGSAESIMYFTEQMAIGTSLTVNQSNDNGVLGLGRLTSAIAYSSKSVTINQIGKGTIKLTQGAYFDKSSTVKVNQTGDGTIDFCDWYNTTELTKANRQNYRESVRRPYTHQNATFTLTQSGKGTINLASVAVVNADSVTIGNGAKLNVQGALTTKALTLASGANLDNTGTLTVGTGAAGSKSTLNVTEGGTLYTILDGKNAALNIGASSSETYTVTAWNMGGASSFGIGFTDDYMSTHFIDSDNSLKFSNVLVATVAKDYIATIENGISYVIGYIGGTDASRWTLASTTALTTDSTTGNVVLSGALIYNPWIGVTTGGTIATPYSDTDADKKLYTGLAISEKDVKLNADNTHSYGTKIDGGTNGITVTLGAEKALGSGENVEDGRAAVETSGKTTLATAGKVVANLPGTIDNKGSLTMQGTYTATDAALGGKTTVEDAYFNLKGEQITTEDGFLRAGSEGYKVVNNIGTATLNPTDTTVTVGGSTYYLYETGYAGLNLIDYTTYYMNSADHEAKVSDIIAASKQLSDNTQIADMVVMNDGKLTVDDNIEVYFNDGEMIMTENGDVSGTINGTDVKTEADGGAISADIKGDSSVTVTNDTTLSGDESDYTGGTLINNATLTLASKQALGNSAVTTKGAAGLETAGSIVANLPATITIEDGSLSMSGKFEANAANLNGGQTETQADAWFDTKGEAGNGFMREGSEAYRVVDVTKGTLKVNALDDVSVTVGGTEYQLYSDGLAGGKLDYSTYFIKGDHQVSVSEIQAANDSDTDTTKVVLESANGSLIADSSIDVETTNGSIEVTNNATVSGSIVDTTVKATGGEIAAAIRGTSSVTVTGETVVSGENDYSGGTLISGKDARLVLKSGSTLGSGVIQLDDHASLDLGQNAIANNIKVTGCELHNASAYTGDIEVSGNLTICGTDATANKVTLIEGGSIAASAAENLTVGTLVVDAGSTISAGTTVTRSLVLNNGAVLTMNGDLTLADGTVITLNGADFVDGQTIISSTGTITMGDVKLECADSDMELELVGNTVVLVLSEPVFDQNKAIACTLSNWGIATASRAFVNAVRGQRNNTGCIANGRGTAWVAVLGGTNEIDGSDIKLEGAAFGADMKVGAASNVGIAFGYVEGEVQPTGLRTVDQEGAYVALYGEHGLKKLGSTSCLSMDWVAAYGITESDVDGLGWEQDSVQLNSRLNWNKKVTDRLCMSVFGGLEYFASNSDTVDGVKTGSIQNLRGEIGVGARYVAWGTSSTSDSKSGMLLNQGCEKLVLHGELRYMNDMVRSNPVIRMNGMSGMGENPGRQGMGIEAGATYRFGERWSASANYGFNTMEDSKEHRVNVGASYTF